MDTNTTKNNTFSVPTPYEMGCLTRSQQRDWDLVVRALHYQGGYYAKLDEYTRRRAWELADGFGRCNIRTIVETLCWDWSHVRDSSEPAVAAMAAFLREAGFVDVED